MFYVYTHSTDDGIVFNVGKGKRKRAWCTHRSNKWHRIVGRHGLNVEIVWKTDSEAEAFAYEIQLISHFGTFTREHGDENIFCNFTPGGVGGSPTVASVIKGRPPWNKGVLASPEARAKMSAAKKGKPILTKRAPPSLEARRKMSVAKKNKPPWNKGKSMPPNVRAKQSVAKKGKPSPNKGKSPSLAARAKMSAARKGKKGRPPWNKGRSLSR